MPIPDDDNLAHLIAAIGGGIEAPIQFILQVRNDKFLNSSPYNLNLNGLYN